MTRSNIRVLVVDDSKVMRLLLETMFSKASDFDLVGVADNGEQAVMMARQLKPDIITMDIMMPIMDGFEATQRIMSEFPIPIVVLSSLMENMLEAVSKALTMGALAAFPKIFSSDGGVSSVSESEFLNSLRALSEVHVFRRQNKFNSDEPSNYPVLVNSVDVLALGVSTGGPEALTMLIPSLTDSFPVPIVVVLHISKGFLKSLVEWMQKSTTLVICIGRHGEELLPGRLYFAPDEYHTIVKKGVRPILNLEKSPLVDNLDPQQRNYLSRWQSLTLVVLWVVC